MQNDEIKEAILVAQSVISEIEDKGLKEKAFEIVLTRLLEGDKDYLRRPKQTRKSVIVKKPMTETPPSVLKFGEEDLLSLKDYYDKVKQADDKIGSELIVLLLCGFLKEKLALDNVSVKDVEYSYKQLLSVGSLKRPPTLKIGDIKRAFGWLVAPSRKKMWLEAVADGRFSISAAGILQLRDLNKKN